MRRFLLLGAMVAVVAGILAAPAGAAQTAHFSVQAIQTSAHGGRHHRFVFTERLRRHHRVVGHDRVECRRTGRRGVFHCHAVFFLHAGKIKAVGNFGRGNHKLAVVGGTSGFNGVSGKLLVHGGGGKRSRLEFLLVR